MRTAVTESFAMVKKAVRVVFALLERVIRALAQVLKCAMKRQIPVMSSNALPMRIVSMMACSALVFLPVSATAVLAKGLAEELNRNATRQRTYVCSV